MDETNIETHPLNENYYRLVGKYRPLIMPADWCDAEQLNWPSFVHERSNGKLIYSRHMAIVEENLIQIASFLALKLTGVNSQQTENVITVESLGDVDFDQYSKIQVTNILVDSNDRWSLRRRYITEDV